MKLMEDVKKGLRANFMVGDDGVLVIGREIMEKAHFSTYAMHSSSTEISLLIGHEDRDGRFFFLVFSFKPEYYRPIEYVTMDFIIGFPCT